MSERLPDMASATSAAAAPLGAPWSPASRVLFRFFFSYFVLFGFPFPFDRVPGLGGLFDTLYYQPSEALAAWVGARIFGHPLSLVQNGETDRTVDFTQNLLIAVLAVVACVVWSILDKRRASYPKHLAALRVYVRYLLMFPLFVYAAVKIVKIQFPDPEPDALLQFYGDSQPGKLLWMFMSHSYLYSAFIGMAELSAGLLLISRRTTTLGAIIASATLCNVLLLNICFNVGVKLWSFNLLVMAVFLASFDARRIANVLVFQRRAEPAAPAALLSVPYLDGWLDERWKRRGKRALKIVLIGLGAFYAVMPVKKYRKPPAPALFGIYDVESFTRNGEPVPLVITDVDVWRGVVVNSYGQLTVRFMNDKAVRYRVKNDEEKKTLALSTWDDDPTQKTVLTYAATDPEHVTLEGPFGGDKIEAHLHKVDRKFRLREEPLRFFYDGPIESKR
jgi:hypothetical protein